MKLAGRSLHGSNNVAGSAVDVGVVELVSEVGWPSISVPQDVVAKISAPIVASVRQETITPPPQKISPLDNTRLTWVASNSRASPDYSNNPRMSSALRLELSMLSASMTLEKSFAFFALRAMTFSSMVSLAIKR